MQEHEIVAAFSASLPIRPDAERVRRVLAAAFIAHTEQLWPAGTDQGSPQWIRNNIDEILATVERLYAAVEETEGVGAIEFLDRMSWLPPLLVELDEARTLDG